MGVCSGGTRSSYVALAHSQPNSTHLAIGTQPYVPTLVFLTWLGGVTHLPRHSVVRVIVLRGGAERTDIPSAVLVRFGISSIFGPSLSGGGLLQTVLSATDYKMEQDGLLGETSSLLTTVPKRSISTRCLILKEVSVP